MIDLHCHVLPEVDDGPGGMDAAVEMVRALEAEGIDTVVATPHLGFDAPAFMTIELRGRCAELELCAKQAGYDVDIEPGAEVTVDWVLDATPPEVRHASIGGHGADLLIDVPHGPLPDHFEAGLASIMDDNYRVTLAHPEVNADFQRSPERLQALIEAGALVQVTARALVRGGSDRRPPSATLARELVQSGLCHVIATDAHSAGPWRAPDLQRGLLEAARLAGARAEWMVEDAPRAILENRELPRPPRSAGTARGLRALRRALAA